MSFGTTLIFLLLWPVACIVAYCAIMVVVSAVTVVIEFFRNSPSVSVPSPRAKPEPATTIWETKPKPAAYPLYDVNQVRANAQTIVTSAQEQAKGAVRNHQRELESILRQERTKQ